MTYQGERARPLVTEVGRCFEVSKVRIGADGHVSQVLWGEVDAWVDQVLGTRNVVSAAEVVDAIHDGAQVTAVFHTANRLPARPFEVVKLADGNECIALSGAPSPGRNLADLAALDD